MAKALGVSVRTLWNWAHRQPKQIGRPRVSQSLRFRALWLTRHEWEKQGHTAGWRPLQRALGPGLSLRLIQSSLAALKARKRTDGRRQRESRRKTLAVLASGAVLRQDSTHLAGSTWAEVLQDAATRELVTVVAGGAVKAQGVIKILQALKLQGRLPLVLQTDNGSAYTSQEVQKYLQEEQVVHLKSRVHTPTDNAGAERAIGELKAEADLACAGPLRSPQQAQAPLAEASFRLNKFRRRRCLGYKTAAEARLEKPGWYTRVNRAGFFEETQARMAEAQSSGGTARQLRSREREAVIRSLEKYGLAEQTRGGCPVATVKPEELS